MRASQEGVNDHDGAFQRIGPSDCGPGIKRTGEVLPNTAGVIRAVQGIDVSIAVGETVALLGPNGAGKSTTIDMVLGLTEPDGGSVSVFGMAPAEAIPAGAIGAMLQTGGLIHDLTVLELVAMVASLYPAPLGVDEALDVAGIEEIGGQRTQTLSGGQTQRVRFAIALVSNPDLLVLDEPTVGMDVEARHAFWTTMRNFAARGKTVVFATHYLEEADAYADRAVLMSNGRIVADEPTTELKAMVGLHTIRATPPSWSPQFETTKGMTWTPELVPLATRSRRESFLAFATRTSL
jgi:ABC-2 type transport system ATP-binding protein